jgi:heat shock protein HtpX
LRPALLHVAHSRQSEQIKAELAGLLLLCASQAYGGGKAAAEIWRTMQAAERRPHEALRGFGARPLQVVEAPALYAILLVICRRAGLRRVPELYLLPFSGMNAYALGNPDNACISVTGDLLRGLSREEIAGIFAHEVAHILHRDGDAMNWAAMMQQAIIDLASRSGSRMLAHAPLLARLLTSALSRVREHAADLRALDLIEDRGALVDALCKLEVFHTGRAPAPRPMGAYGSTALNSHPETWERIAHLS